MAQTEEHLPGISWAELQTVLLSLADTPVKKTMVHHLVGGTRKQAAFLSPEATFREILHIGAALLDSGFQPQESDMTSSAASCLSLPSPQ